MDSGDADGQIWDDSLFLWHQVSLNIISSLYINSFKFKLFSRNGQGIDIVL
jgi:hypothetical protein